jgi:predicted AlkP superfamily phosphohydrolase/phosphomutase
VEPGEEEAKLLAELAGKLLAVKDPAKGRAVISRVDKAKEVYHGPYVQEAPDLILGYNLGYRAGWKTVLGQFSWEVLEDNLEPWSGDHCIDPRLVPGVLLSNKKILHPSPALTDLAPTLLAEFGIAKPVQLPGVSVFAGTAAGSASATD